MKLPILSVGLLALLTPLTSAWSKEDHEIFRVRDELVIHEGADISFYDYLGVAQTASQDEINRAYRKKSKALHPDKVKQQLTAERTTKNKSSKDKSSKKKPGVNVSKGPTQAEIKAAVKAAGDRQARLGLVANILRGSGRARYDHFVANGFPTWKGTGYYYSRYRPGLGTVLVGCFIAGGGAFHYVALYMSWKRQREFVDRYIKFARHAAWGEDVAIPGIDGVGAALPPQPAAPAATEDEQQAPMMAMNRKQKRLQERDAKKEKSKGDKRMGRGRGGGGGRPASGSATPVPQTQASDGTGPTGAKKRVQAENGKILVVDSLGDVYLEQADAEGNVQEFLLDPSELPQPSIRDTALWKLPLWAYGKTAGRFLGGRKAGADESSDDEAEDVVEELAADDDSDAPQRTPSTDSAEDFELLDTSKSVEDLAKKATGSQAQGGGKAKKRSKKR